MPGITIGENRATPEQWDRFVAQAATATFFHRFGWSRVLFAAFGHASYYLHAEREGQLSGILPLGLIRSRWFGTTLVSTPFCVYGGVVASDPESRLALEQAAIALAYRLKVDHLELRERAVHPVPVTAQAVDAPGAGRDEWLVKELYYTFSRPIHPDPERNLAAIPRKQRAEVRHAIERGNLEWDEEPDSDRCWSVYAESVHRLGTPVFSRDYFRCLLREFGGDCHILTITRHGAPLSSVLSFRFRDEILPYYGGGVAAAREVNSTHFMYWKLMELAARDGARRFDFGRSKAGTGAFQFKRLFGFEPELLPYRYRLIRAARLAEVNPLNPKYRRLIGWWRRLPLPVANTVGPWIARSLG